MLQDFPTFFVIQKIGLHLLVKLADGEPDEAPPSVKTEAVVAAPKRRIDTADGKAYTREEFKREYGGTAEWRAAGGQACGWDVMYDPQTEHVYYSNKHTQESQWAAPQQPALQQLMWQQPTPA